MSEIDKVDAEWVSNKMDDLGVTIKSICDETGLDRSNVSAWINGLRPLSKNVKILFYYYFKSKKM